MQAISAFVFDFENVLFSPEPAIHRLAYNRAFAEQHLDWLWDEALFTELSQITDGPERIRFYLENFHLQCGFQHDVSKWLDALYRLKQKYLTSIISCVEITPRKGIVALLETLVSHQCSIIMISTQSQATGETWLQHYFDDSISAITRWHTVGNLSELVIFDTLSPSTTVFVSSEQSALLNAQKMGYKTVALKDVNTPNEFTGTELTTHDLSAITAHFLVKKING